MDITVITQSSAGDTVSGFKVSSIAQTLDLKFKNFETDTLRRPEKKIAKIKYLISKIGCAHILVF